MAAPHFDYSQSLPFAIQIRNMFGNLENSFNSLVNNNGLVGTMKLMIDGDGSQDVHYHPIAVAAGFADDATARAAFNEILSVQGKLDSDASVSNVNAAVIQAINKFR